MNTIISSKTAQYARKGRHVNASLLAACAFSAATIFSATSAQAKVKLEAPAGYGTYSIDQPVTAYTTDLVEMEGCTAAYKTWFHAELKKAFAAKSFVGLRKALQQRFKLSANATSADLKKQLENPDASMGLAQFGMLIDLSGALPNYAMARPNANKFLTELFTDRDLIETILISGLADWMAPKFEPNMQFTVVHHLQDVWEKDPNYARHKTTRNLAVGLAVGHTSFRQMHITGYQTTLKKYELYRAGWLKGRFDKSFAKTEAWAMRYFLSTPSDKASHLWAQKHIRTPMKMFSTYHYNVPRRGVNMFGYVMSQSGGIPWHRYTQDSYLRKTMLTGGVCGAQSSATTYMIGARGIPATVIGGNGHCMYAWRHPDGYWVGGYGGPDSNGHYGLYGFSPAFLYVAEDAHRDVKAVLAARRHVWQAQLSDSLKSDNLTSLAWELATDANLKGYVTWSDRLNWLNKHPKLIRWSSIEPKLIAGLKANPYPMMELVGIIEKTALPNIAQRKGMWERLYASSKGNWKNVRYLEHTLRDHLLRLETEDDKMSLAEALLPALFTSAQGGYVMNWAEKQFGTSPEGSKRNVAAFQRVLSKMEAAGGGDKRAITKLYSTLISQSAASGDINTFNTLAKRARLTMKVKPWRMPKFKPFSGINLAKGGALVASPRSSRDNPAIHPWVLDEQKGGEFTASGDKPGVRVQLPKVGKINGIVIINHPKSGIQGRQLPSVVEVSTDGEKWDKVARITKPQEVYRIPVTRSAEYIRYVRVRHEAKQGRYSLYGIFVYGNKQE